MVTPVFYNDNDPAACHVLRHLSVTGVVPPGRVAERDIRELTVDDLAGFLHCHLFAGAGMWAIAAEMAGWPRSWPLWTASTPCQPWSAARAPWKRGGTGDERDLWPDVFDLVRAARPVVLVGEQVAGADGRWWLDRTGADLEGSGYAFRTVILPACSVDAPHERERAWFVAVLGDAERPRLEGYAGDGFDGAERAKPGGFAAPADDRAEPVECWDGWRRRSIAVDGFLADGVPGRVDLWRLAGNAIVPEVGAQVLISLKEAIMMGEV